MTTRNQFGLKDTIDRYRVFGGERFVGWAADNVEARLTAYRAAGVRCRCVDGEVFVRDSDKIKATKVDSL